MFLAFPCGCYPQVGEGDQKRAEAFGGPRFLDACPCSASLQLVWIGGLGLDLNP